LQPKWRLAASNNGIVHQMNQGVMNKKDSLMAALGIMNIVVELLAYSQPLGIIIGVAILIYLYLITEESPSP